MSDLRSSSQYYHVVLERMAPKPFPAFDEPDMLERVWGKQWGVQNDVGTLKTILLHRPGEELEVMCDDSRYDPTIDALVDDDDQWYFRSDKGPDIAAMQAEHDALAQILRQYGVEIITCRCSPVDPNAMFVRDCGMVVPGGIIISRMGTVGKRHGTGRRGEEAYVTKALASAGMPILHTIHGSGLMEGGSFVLLDRHHAAIGMSYRGNSSGADQVEAVLKQLDIELIRIPLVGYSMHLDGGIVMIDHDKAIVNVERLPYWFLDRLKELGIEPIWADYRDVGLAVNCLALKPGVIVADAAAPYTADKLRKRGLTVIPTPWSECRKHGGGIHCSTLPLIRENN